MEPLISIVIPFYNAAAFLRQCLDSLVCQTYGNLEIVCVDDASEDGSRAIPEQMSREDPRIKVIGVPKSNAGVARNAGYAVSKGDCLLFLDADDVFAPDMVATLVRGLKDHEAEISICGWQPFDDGGPVPGFDGGDDAWSVVDAPARNADVYGTWMGWAWDKLVSRSLIDREGLDFQSLRSSNDLFFSFSALVAARRVAQTARRLVAHRKAKSTLSETRDRDPLCFSAALRAHYRFLEKHDLAGETSHLLWCYRRYSLPFGYWHLDTMRTDDSYARTYLELRKVLAELGTGKLQDRSQAVSDRDIARYKRVEEHPTPIAYLRAEVTRLESESDELGRSCACLQQARSALEAEKSALLAEKSALLAETAALASEKAALQLEKGRLEQANFELTANCELSRTECERVKMAFRAMENSVSFKVGRVLTALPRALRNLVSKGSLAQ